MLELKQKRRLGRVGDMNRHVASSPIALVQFLATNLLTSGYRYYVTGHVPEPKAPAAVDAKLIAKYDLGLSRWELARRKRIGYASVRYVRCGRFFIMVATEGQHPWFREERGLVRDARKEPITYGGYHIGLKRGPDRGTSGQPRDAHRLHVRVSLTRKTYTELKAYFLELGVHGSVEELRHEFRSVPFEPYAPVRRQLLNILRAVNRARKRANKEQLPFDVLRYRRRIVKVFDDHEVVEAA